MVGGAWSLVQVTLYSIEAAVEAFPKATHFYMISGDCMPTKSAVYITNFWIHRMLILLKALIFFAVIGSKRACAKSA